MSLLAVKGDFDGTSVGHNQGIYKTAIGGLRDYLNDLFGANTLTRDAVANALKFYQQGQIFNVALTFAVGSNALTIAVKGRDGNNASTSNPVIAMMRSATAGAGDFSALKLEAALSLVISSGSTLGHVSTKPGWIYYYLISNAGALELAASSTYFGPQGIVTTTAEGGGGAADSTVLMYSTTARTNVAFVCIGRSQDTQTTAGTWTALPTLTELAPFDTLRRETDPRTANTALDVSDHGKTIIATGTFTQTLVAVATLGDDWKVFYRNDGNGVVTVDPNSTETIDGATTLTLNPGDSCMIVSTGAAFKTIGLSQSSLPQNSQSAAYTTVLADQNKHIYHPAGDNNARTFTIDSNANVPYPIGTTLTFVNKINTVTISITSDTLTLAGTGATGSRTLAAVGIATAIKVTATEWIISGVNVA